MPQVKLNDYQRGVLLDLARDSLPDWKGTPEFGMIHDGMAGLRNGSLSDVEARALIHAVNAKIDTLENLAGESLPYFEDARASLAALAHQFSDDISHLL